MALTTSDVEEIYDGTVNAVSVTAAENISKKLSDCDYTDAELLEIQRWLGAHVQAMIDGKSNVVGKKQGERSISYSDTFGKNLKATRYGQVAVSLDTCGKLANIGKQKASFNVL